MYSGNNSSSEVSTAEEGYDLEFRSYRDDAWYSARVLLEGDRGDKLRVKYENFADDHDNVFDADGFESIDELKDLAGRFRKVSIQLQDRDCSKVVKGTRVLASGSFGNDEFLFYEAIVDEVVHRKHSYVNGEEECQCSFLLCWLHGPNVGKLADKEVANICIPQGAELGPKLISFMEIAKQKIEKSLCKSTSGTSNGRTCIPLAQREENGSPFVELKPNISGREKQGKCVQQSFSEVWPSEEGAKVHYENRQDTDLGGEKKQYILVQNLDKELSSSTLLEFILKKTSIAPQVYIFPSLPWEPYTNGVIVLDCKKDLEKLFGFLQNPTHFVVSSNGRPLVVAEKMPMNGHWIAARKSPNILSNRRGGVSSTELKVVCLGSEEFDRAKKLSDLFLGFIHHQKGLYEKLGMEERSISSLLK